MNIWTCDCIVDGYKVIYNVKFKFFDYLISVRACSIFIALSYDGNPLSSVSFISSVSYTWAITLGIVLLIFLAATMTSSYSGGGPL